MSFIRSGLKQIGRVVLLPFQAVAKNKFNNYFTENQRVVNDFAEMHIYSDVVTSLNNPKRTHALLHAMLKENKQLADSVKQTSLSGTDQSEYVMRFLDFHWELLECLQFILKKNAKQFSEIDHHLLEKYRIETLRELIARLKLTTPIEMTNPAQRAALIQTMAKLYLYCEEKKLAELKELQSCIQTLLVTPEEIFKFYQNELIPYHPDPKTILSEGFEIVRSHYTQETQPSLLLDRNLLLDMQPPVEELVGADNLKLLKPFYDALPRFRENESPLSYGALLPCITVLNEMQVKHLQRFSSLPVHNIILYYSKMHIINEARTLLIGDEHFFESCQKLSPYHPRLYRQLERKYDEQKVSPEATANLTSVVIFASRRLQLVLRQEKHKILDPVYQEEKNQEQTYQQKLLAYPKRKLQPPVSLVPKPLEVESKSPVSFLPREENKTPVIAKSNPSAKSTLEMALPSCSSSLAALFSLPQTRKPGKKSHTPFRSGELKEASERKSAKSKKATSDPQPESILPIDKFRARQEVEKSKVRDLIDEKKQEQRCFRAKESEKARLASLVKYKLTLTAKAELAPKVLEYAKRISPLGLAAIHGGSVRDAIKKSFALEIKETKEAPQEDQDEIHDVDIVIYDSALDDDLEKVFPKKDFKLIPNGKKIITVAPLSLESNCSVQIVRKFDLGNPHTIIDSALECDFTINTFIAIHKQDTQEIVFYSPLGDEPLKHLRENKLVVAHPGGADMLFKTNPICMLRALRFVIEKGYTPTEDVFPSIISNAKKILEPKLVAPQAVNSHLTKLLTHGRASRYVDNLAFQVLFCELFSQFSTVDMSTLKSIFSYIDETSHGKPKPLTRIYAALLMAQSISQGASRDSLTSSMEMSYQENIFIKAAFSRMSGSHSASTRALLFKSVIEDFSFLSQDQDHKSSFRR